MYRFLNYSNKLVVDLEEIMVRLEDCIGVTVGPVEPGIVRALEENNFDQASVWLKNKCFIGGISTKRLRQLLESGEELLENDKDLKLNEIYSPYRLTKLLEFLSEHSFGFVTIKQDGGEYGTDYPVVGLITISDLNKHYIRSLVYVLLSELEKLLGMFIKTFCPDPWEWLDQMNNETLVRVLGYWELSKRRNVDIGPIEACTISDLLNVISKGQRLHRKLGYISRKNFDKANGRIPELRNSIMHPVRPLVNDSKDVISLKRTVESVMELVTRLQSLRKQELSSNGT